MPKDKEQVTGFDVTKDIPPNIQTQKISEQNCKKTFSDPAYDVLQPLLQEKHQNFRSVDSMDEIRYAPKASANQWSFFLKVFLLISNPIGWITAIILFASDRITRVKEGEIGLVQNDTRYEFLKPGWYLWFSPLRSLTGIVKANESLIENGNRTILTLRPGEVACAMDGGKPVFMGPGIHEWEGNTIKFTNTDIYNIMPKSSDHAQAHAVEIGPYTYVTVPTSHVAVTYDYSNKDGDPLKVLGQGALVGDTPPEHKGAHGTYLLKSQNWKFHKSIDTSEQFNEIRTDDHVLTADRVEIALVSSINWKVTHPKKAALQDGDMEKVKNIVREQALAVVADMIGSLKISSGIQIDNLNDSNITHRESKEGKDPAQQQPAATNKAQPKQDAIVVDTDVLENNVKKSQAELCRQCNKRLAYIGVTVHSLNIISMNIVHQEIREQLARVAVIPTIIQEQRMVADTEAQNIVTKANANMEAKILEGKAEAKRIELIADAESKATVLNSKANKEAVELIAQDPLGSQLQVINAEGKALSQIRNATFFVNAKDRPKLLLNYANSANSAKTGRSMNQNEDNTDSKLEVKA